MVIFIVRYLYYYFLIYLSSFRDSLLRCNPCLATTIIRKVTDGWLNFLQCYAHNAYGQYYCVELYSIRFGQKPRWL